jgi:hypothetical protein
MKQFSNKTRAIVFVVSAAFVTLFGFLGASWSNPVLADGTNNIQPLVAPSETAQVHAPQAVGGPCDSPAILLNDTLGKVIASAVVLPTPTKELCTLLQVVPEPNALFPVTFPEFQIPATGLFGAGSLNIASAPTGYTRITDAAQFGGVIGGNKVKICFVLPTNSASFKSQRVAYYDTTPGINRWVFLTTKVDKVANQACMTKGLFKPVPPVVFALFGQN